MPLIIITGLPSSGKTRVANELKNFFEEKSKKVNVISESDIIKDAGLSKNELYVDSKKENEIRSIIKSTFIRAIGPEELVIIDGLNYIKGYRYELYCATKSAKTTQCTVHCQTGREIAWEYNSNRESSEQYSQEVFDALVLRYEPPDGRNRWDSPLFYLMSDSSVPVQDIHDALYCRQPPPPNESTQCPPLPDTNFLHELDKAAQLIISTILENIRLNRDGPIKMPGSDEFFVISSNKDISMPELLRMKRQFLSYVKQHPTLYNSRNLMSIFVQYLNTHIPKK